MPENASAELRQSPRRNILQTGLETLQAGKERGLLLVDISKSGIGIQSIPGLELEKLTRFSFTLPGLKQSLEATGMMAWSDEAGRAGFRFIDMNHNAGAQLERWLEDDLKAAVSHPPSELITDAAVRTLFEAERMESRAVEPERREQKRVSSAKEIPQSRFAERTVPGTRGNLSKLRIVLTPRQLILSGTLFFIALTAASVALILVATTAYRAVISGPLVQTSVRPREPMKAKPELPPSEGSGSPALPETHKAKLKAESSRIPSPSASAPAATRTRVAGGHEEQLADQLVALGEKYSAVDCKAALNYFETAASMEDPRALIHLGAMYATGKCVSMDPVMAYKTFVRANKRAPGNRWLRQNLQALLAQMTPEQRESIGK